METKRMLQSIVVHRDCPFLHVMQEYYQIAGGEAQVLDKELDKVKNSPDKNFYDFVMETMYPKISGDLLLKQHWKTPTKNYMAYIANLCSNMISNFDIWEFDKKNNFINFVIYLCTMLLVSSMMNMKEATSKVGFDLDALPDCKRGGIIHEINSWGMRLHLILSKLIVMYFGEYKDFENFIFSNYYVSRIYYLHSSNDSFRDNLGSYFQDIIGSASQYYVGTLNKKLKQDEYENIRSEFERRFSKRFIEYNKTLSKNNNITRKTLSKFITNSKGKKVKLGRFSKEYKHFSNAIELFENDMITEIE